MFSVAIAFVKGAEGVLNGSSTAGGASGASGAFGGAVVSGTRSSGFVFRASFIFSGLLSGVPRPAGSSSSGGGLSLVPPFNVLRIKSLIPPPSSGVLSTADC